MANMYALRGYVRYDSKGDIIPGTFVLLKNRPSGRFKEVVCPTISDKWAQTPCSTIVGNNLLQDGAGTLLQDGSSNDLDMGTQSNIVLKDFLVDDFLTTDFN